ncbi:hypothetical protein [Xenorhabdus bharatensis]|uniref:hypothetical protein n=1 Tax=Xenorhabdus bharatensis TaxID=3136256 RepID=UPI0030F4328F
MRIENKAVQKGYEHDNEQYKKYFLPESINFSTSNLTGRKEMNVMLEKRFENMEVDVSQLKTDVTQLKSDVTQLKSDVTELKIDVGIIKNTHATKADIESVKVLIYTEIASVKKEMASIHKTLLEKIASQTKWMVTMMFGFSGIIIAAMKLMLPS